MQVLVARIGKPHGIRGEVTVELFTDALKNDSLAARCSTLTGSPTVLSPQP